MLQKKKIEIIAFERERIVRRPSWVTCPVCHAASELLTTRQAGALAQVEPQSIYRWLAAPTPTARQPDARRAPPYLSEFYLSYHFLRGRMASSQIP